MSQVVLSANEDGDFNEIPHVDESCEIASNNQNMKNAASATESHSNPTVIYLNSEINHHACSDDDDSSYQVTSSVDSKIVSVDKTSHKSSDHNPICINLQTREYVTTEPLIEYLTKRENEGNQTCKISSHLVNKELSNKLHPVYANSRKRQRKHGDASYKCNICGKVFAQRHALIEHHVVHTDERPYVCHICKKTYRHRSALNKHKRFHFDYKMYTCGKCGKQFKTKSYLSIHAVIHTQDRPYSCNICGFAFRDRSARNKHVHAHLGIKPYSCELCGKCFARKGDYRTHQIIHTEKRPYSCSICGQSFQTSSNCTRHIRLHINNRHYKCGESGKAFKQKWALKKHKHVHFKETSFKYSVSGIGFKYSRNHWTDREEAEDVVSPAEIIDVKPDISPLID